MCVAPRVAYCSDFHVDARLLFLTAKWGIVRRCTNERLGTLKAGIRSNATESLMIKVAFNVYCNRLVQLLIAVTNNSDISVMIRTALVRITRYSNQ